MDAHELSTTASNNISDQGECGAVCFSSVVWSRTYSVIAEGFYYVVQYLLLSSAPPKSLSPTLTKLYLSNNNITLSPSSPLPSLLSAALSHPNSQLYFLSLISNEGLHLDFLRLCTPATLRVLQIDTCALSDYRSLLGFLSRKDGGGRLEQLRANGNYFGTRGVRRLAKLVADGRNTSLLRFELSANSVANSRVASQDNLQGMTSLDNSNNNNRQQDDSSSEDDGENPLELDNGVDVSSVFMIPGLAKALGRNAVLREMTQLSALKMLPYARLLLNAQPPPEPSSPQLMDSIYKTNSSGGSSACDTVTMSTEQLKDMAITSPSNSGESFPWLKLPMEIRLAVLSQLGQLLDADRASKMVDVIQTRLPAQYRTRRILSAGQWQHLLAFAGDKATLRKHLEQQQTLRAVQCEQWEAHS